MKRKNKIYLIVIISFIILATLSDLLFMVHHVLFDAWDMQFHLKRIMELIDSFNNFKFSPFSFNQFNGSAVMGLYPYVNLFPMVLLSHFIQSKITLIYIFFALNTFLSLMICFFSSLSVSKNKWTSYLFAVIYSLSTVLLGYNYFFMDLGMSTVVTFLPLVIFGFVHLLKDNRYIELIIGMCLIAFSHVLSVFIVSLFLLILLLIEYKYWTKELWENVVKVFIITAFITSIVWLPVVYLLFTNNINSPTLLKLQGLPNKIVLISLFGGTNPMGLGTFVIISAILSLFYWNHFNKFTKKLYLISIITIIICSKVFPWKFIPNFIAFPLAHFQFTYRFLIVPILLLDYIFALIVTQYINKKKWRNSVICVSLIAAVGLRVFMQYHFISKNISQPTFSLVSNKYNKENTINYKMSNNKQVNSLINFRPNGMNKNGYAADYYPKAAVSKVHYINNNEATYDRNRTINVEHRGYNRFSFDSPKKINRLALPLLHYNGEHLRVYVNHHLVHSHANGNSLVTLDNVKKGRSVVGVRSVQNVWIVVMKSVLFVIGMVWLIWIYFKYSFLDKFERNEVDLYIKKFIKDYRRVIVLDTFLITIFIILSIKPLPHIDDYLMGIFASFTVTGFLYTYHCGRKIGKHRTNIWKIHKKHKHGYYSTINDLKGHMSNFDYQFGKALKYANKLSQLPRNSSSSIIFKYICGINTILSNVTQEYCLYMKQDIGEIQWNLLYVHRFRNEFRGRMDRYSELIKKNCNNIFSDLDKIPSYSYMLNYMTFSQKKRKKVCKNIKTQLSNMHALSKTCVNEISIMK